MLLLENSIQKTYKHIKMTNLTIKEWKLQQKQDVFAS